MTIAIDRKSGAVVGQVTNVRTRPLFGGSLPANEAVAQPWKVVVLTASGYRSLDADSVRLEHVD